MSTLTQIVDGLRDQLATIDRLAVYEYVPGSVSDYPVALIIPPAIDYQQAMGAGVARMELEVVLLVGAFEAKHQTHLFEFLDVTGDRSVRAAVAANNTLGLTDVDCVVMSSRPLGLEEIGAYNAWGASFLFLIAYTN